MSVRSPCAWSSSSGVGGSGRLGGPPPELCGDPLLVLLSSESTDKPGLYENSGLTKPKSNKKQNDEKMETENVMCVFFFQ